jgi:hypothetical protein
MMKREPATGGGSDETQMDLRHLRREAQTALELALVALAPSELSDRLALAAGLLEALVELPPSSAPVVARIPALVARAKSALAEWQKWQKEHLEKKIPRG